MKKILICIIGIIIALSTYPTSDFLSMSDSYSSECLLYTDEAYDNTSVKLMSGVYETKLSISEANSYDFEGFQGFTVKFNGTESDVDSYLSTYNATKIFSQKVDDILIVYGYCDKLSESVDMKSRQVNLQIAINKGVVNIGYPLIIGAY